MSLFELELLKHEAQYGYSDKVRVKAIHAISEKGYKYGALETIQCIAIDSRSDVWKSALKVLILFSHDDLAVTDFIEKKAKNLNKWDDIHWYFIATAIYLGRGDEELWQIIKYGILETSIWHMDYLPVVVRALSRCRNGCSDTLPFLKKLCVLKRANGDYGLDEIIRISAIQQLARGWKGDAEVYLFLKKRFSMDSDVSVRAQIFKEILRGWDLDIGEAKDWVTKGLNHPSYELRSEVVYHLSSVLGKNTEVFNILERLAVEDPDFWVRAAAIVNLSNSFPNNDIVKRILQKSAVKDRRGEVRLVALEKLARYSLVDSEILMILKDRAEKDRHSEVREGAVKMFGHFSMSIPECFRVLTQITLNDKQGIVCNVALKLIAQGWNDEENVLHTLANVVQDSHWRGSHKLALELFLSYNKDIHSVIPVLKNIALSSDYDAESRVLAINKLVELKDEDNDIYWSIKRLVDIEVTVDVNDSGDVERINKSVSAAAIKALAKGWKEMSDAKNLIMGFLADENSTRVYDASIEALVEGWSDDPLIQLLIANIIVTSEDARRFRREFTQLLKNTDKGIAIESRILEMLRGREYESTFRSDEEIRIKALQRLVADWKIDIDMLSWLKMNSEEYGEKDWQLANLREIYNRWPNDHDIAEFGIEVMVRMNEQSASIEKVDTEDELHITENSFLGITYSDITCEDIDGHVYNSVLIGGQVWMARHLDVSRYRNGDSVIHAVSDEWQGASKSKVGAWCFLYDDPMTEYEYGKLYNWYAVNDPRGLAPIGWHIATDQDWKQLELALGMNPDEIDEEDDLRGTNQQICNLLKPRFQFEKDIDFNGFNALPAGFRRDDDDDCIFDQSDWCYIWTSSEAGSEIAWQRTLSFQESEGISRISLNKAYGMSIRCVKDSL
jgi:uncharacterized protein (TIGR02145 family)